MKPPRSVPALQRRVRKQVTIRPEFEAFRPSVNPEMNQKMYQMKEDVPLINYRVGINVNPSLVAIPCMTIAERNNVVVMGKGVGFDSTEYNLLGRNCDVGQTLQRRNHCSNVEGGGFERKEV